MVRNVEEYLLQATQCREAAERTVSAAEKHRLVQMAETWEVLARQRTAYLQLETMLAKIKGDDAGGSDGA